MNRTYYDKKNFAIIYKLVESDHCPIVFSLKAQPFCNTNKSIKAYDHVAEYKAYHKYSWNVSRIDQYKLSLRNDECIKIINHLTLNATSDRSSDHICELIQNLIKNASFGIFKKVNINTNNSSEKQMPTNAWFDSECNELRKTINTYAKRTNLTDTDNNNDYFNLCNDYKRMIQRKKRNYNTNLKLNLEKMGSKNPKDYWGFWKRLQRQNRRDATIELHPFYDCFLNQSVPPTGQNAGMKLKIIQKGIPIDTYKYDISNDILNGKIQMDEVEKALIKIKKGKASGIDVIPIDRYSSDIKYFTPLLTTLFNTIFDSANHPKDWAQGLIYPVHKKGDKSDAQNYRKVSLIPSLAKVFESVLENRLSYKNLVCCDDDPLQRGFKKDCRTSDNLFVLYNLVETQKSREKPLYICYIDLTKAFEYLNRDALIVKLQQRNVDGKFLNTIKSMFHKSSSPVKWNGKISKPINNRYGAMQGVY